MATHDTAVRRPAVRAWAAATAGVLALGLGLTACGDDDDKGSNQGGGPETADIRVWINGADTPQEARDWLKETFEDDHPGSTLTIEEQEWEGLVERLTTALSSESETPDVVEVGNTQAPTFTSAGAFSDLTGDLDDLGGDDLLPGFVDGATVDGTTYAVPYYAGSKYVFYRKDLFEKAGLVGADHDRGVRADRHRPQEGQPGAGGVLGLLVPGPGLAQRRVLPLGRRRRPGRRGRRRVERRAVDARVDRGAGDRPDADDRGVRRTQGRQRGRPADPVLCRRDRHDVRAGLGHRADRGPRDGLPRHDGERRRLRAARSRRLPRRRCCSAARTSRSRPSRRTRTSPRRSSR